MDRYEKLWAVVTAAREAIPGVAKARAEGVSYETASSHFTETYARPLFRALIDFHGETPADEQPVCYVVNPHRLDTRTLATLRDQPDVAVVLSIAADFIATDRAPLRSGLCPELDDFSTLLKKAII